MKLKSVLLLAVALGCGLVAMLGYQQAMSQNRGRSGDEKQAKVLVAKTEVVPGTPLTDENTEFKAFPIEAVPQGAVTKKEEYEQRALKVRTYPGEIVMKAKLGEKGEFGASSDIPAGMRIISVPVDPTMTNSGLIWPGSRVDVFVTFRSTDRRVGTEIASVLENVEVFALDNNRDAVGKDPSEIKAKNISLLVTPEEAMRLKRAEEMGKLHVAMRRTDDATHVNAALHFDQVNAPFGDPVAESNSGTDEGGLTTFLGQQASAENSPKPKPVEDATPRWKIQILSGGEERIEEVDLNEPAHSSIGPGAVSAAMSDGNPLLGYLKRVLKTP